MQIIKSFRKTLSLKIDNSGEIIVKVPYFTTKKTINNFLEKYKDWIEKSKKNILKNKNNFTFGEEFYFLGNKYKLIHSENKFVFDSVNFLTNLSDSEKIKNEFVKFYKKEAKKYIKSRVLEISEKLDLKFNKIRVTSAKTRWGSCSSKKNLNFSWRLIMLSKESIDYVIIHELSHLKEMNHSKKFWDLVQEYLDILNLNSYKYYRKEIKKYSHIFL